MKVEEGKVYSDEAELIVRLYKEDDTIYFKCLKNELEDSAFTINKEVPLAGGPTSYRSHKEVKITPSAKISGQIYSTGDYREELRMPRSKGRSLVKMKCWKADEADKFVNNMTDILMDECKAIVLAKGVKFIARRKPVTPRITIAKKRLSSEDFLSSMEAFT